MKFKLSIIGLVVIASNLAMASSLTPEEEQADRFIVTYQNNTFHPYTYTNNLPRDSTKIRFNHLGSWRGTGQLAHKESITFTGILDKSKESTHWVKFMLKNNDTGQEAVYELENPAVGEPILHSYMFGQEIRPERLYKQNGHYIINLQFWTEKSSRIDIPFLNVNMELLKAYNPRCALDNNKGIISDSYDICCIWSLFECN
jgi:hypothetical protein